MTYDLVFPQSADNLNLYGILLNPDNPSQCMNFVTREYVNLVDFSDDCAVVVDGLGDKLYQATKPDGLASGNYRMAFYARLGPVRVLSVDVLVYFDEQVFDGTYWLTSQDTVTGTKAITQDTLDTSGVRLGEVRDRRSHAPLSDARMVVSLATDTQFTRVLYEGLTDGDGEFSVLVRTGATYRLKPVHSGFRDRDTAINVKIVSV